MVVENAGKVAEIEVLYMQNRERRGQLVLGQAELQKKGSGLPFR